MVNIEYTQRGIHIAGPTAESVCEEIFSFMRRYAEWGAWSFIAPVKDADGMFVTRGHMVEIFI